MSNVIKKGVALTELLIVIGIFFILAAGAIPAIYNFQKHFGLDNSAAELLNILKLAQSKTIASEGSSQWGVELSDTTVPEQYTLFKGASYASRDSAFDEVYKLPKNVEFSEINLAGGGKEVVFKRITGLTEQFGNIALVLKNEPSKSKTIYLENSGNIGLTLSPVDDSGRLRDSRHIHLDYGRVIDALNEKIILTFDGGVIQEIKISDELQGGQIFWQGEVDVGGEKQKLKIHTHRLNNPDTQFCIHRDVRYNTKWLNIDIDGDPNYPALSPTLIRYNADNSTTKGNSATVSEPIWQ